MFHLIVSIENLSRVQESNWVVCKVYLPRKLKPVQCRTSEVALKPGYTLGSLGLLSSWILES